MFQLPNSNSGNILFLSHFCKQRFSLSLSFFFKNDQKKNFNSQLFLCTYSPEYTAAIERKQVEQQIAERQKFIVEKSKQEKLAAVIRVEGETEAGRLLSEAMKISPEFLELRTLFFSFFSLSSLISLPLFKQFD